MDTDITLTSIYQTWSYIGKRKLSYSTFSDLKTFVSLKYSSDENMNDSLMEKLLGVLCIIQRILSDLYKLHVSII